MSRIITINNRDYPRITKKTSIIGSVENKHDLSGLNEPLRSHGGLHEREVPFIINMKMKQIDSDKQLYNYDAFYYAILGASL